MLVAFSSKAGISAPTIGNNVALFLNMLVDKIVQTALRAISYNLQPYAAKLFAVLFYRNGNSTFMFCCPSSFASAFLSTKIKFIGFNFAGKLFAPLTYRTASQLLQPTPGSFIAAQPQEVL